jgi:hypothetical protein
MPCAPSRQCGKLCRTGDRTATFPVVIHAFSAAGALTGGRASESETAPVRAPAALKPTRFLQCSHKRLGAPKGVELSQNCEYRDNHADRSEMNDGCALARVVRARIIPRLTLMERRASWSFDIRPVSPAARPFDEVAADRLHVAA